MSPRAAALRWRALVLLGTAFFMTILDGTSLLTALPAVEREFRVHGTAVHWAVTAYALAFAGLLLCGRAADLLGRRRAFLAGISLRVLASLGRGFALTVEAPVAARALQGVSAAIIAPAALPMVMNAFAEGSERNRALGIWGWDRRVRCHRRAAARRPDHHYARLAVGLLDRRPGRGGGAASRLVPPSA